MAGKVGAPPQPSPTNTPAPAAQTGSAPPPVAKAPPPSTSTADGPLSRQESDAIGKNAGASVAREKTSVWEDILDFLVGIFTFGKADTRFFDGKVSKETWATRAPMLVEVGGSRLKHALFGPGVTKEQATARLAELIQRTNPGMPEKEARHAAEAMLPALEQAYADPRLTDTALDGIQTAFLRDQQAYGADAGKWLSAQAAPKPPPPKNAIEMEAQLALESPGFAKLDAATRQKIAQLCFQRPELREAYRQLPDDPALLSLPVGPRQKLLLAIAGHAPPELAMAELKAALPAIAALPASLQGEICEALKDAVTDPARFANLTSLLQTEGFAALDSSLQRKVLDGSIDMKWMMLALKAGAFNGLDAAAQAKLADVGQKWGGAELSALAQLDPDTRAKILALPPDVRALAVTKMAAHVSDGDARVIAKVVSLPGFAKLDSAQQTKLIRYIGGTSILSNEARAGLNDLMGATDWPTDPTKQKDVLAKWLDKQPSAPGGLGAAMKPGGTTYAAYKVTGPTEVKNYAFEGGPADALKYEVEIDGKKTPVYLAKHKDPNSGPTHDIDSVAKGLAALPPESRALVKEVRVNPKPNSQDAYWAVKYNDKKFHSYMTAGAAGTVDIYANVKGDPLGPQLQLENSMIHETGHVLSGKMWGDDTDGPQWKPWRDAIAKDKMTPSQYAKNSPGEDFSEFLVLYQSVKGTPAEAELRELMPERFKVFDAMVAAKKTPD
jgi:hypothetical protein